MLMLKKRFDKPEGRQRPGRPAALSLSIEAGACLCLALSLAAAPALAQDGLGFGSGSIGNHVEQQAEEQVEEQVEEQIEEEIAEQVDERIDELGFGYSEQKIEEQVEEQIEDTVEEAVNEEIDENLEQIVEESIEEDVEQEIEEAVTQNIEENLDEQIEETVSATIEGSVEENLEQSVASSVEDSIESSVEQDVAQSIDDSVDQVAMTAVEDQLEGQIDEVLEGIESKLEINEDRINKDQWLVMAEKEVFDDLAKEGYLFDKFTELPGLGLMLAEVAAPSSFDITDARKGVLDVVGSDGAEVDLNHLYAAGTLEASSKEGVTPRSAIQVPPDTTDKPLRIGMIDSQVDLSHPSLQSASIQSRSFTVDDASTPDFHGTAVASIISASAPGYEGLAPSTELYAASVFEVDKEHGEIASTISLVRALDWLLSSEVEVVNISLAGPPNRLLEAALKRAAQRDIVIVAAAGNGGPAAQPMYPAAYNSVVAVTAVDSSGRVFRLANRGDYLDLAAPGVDLVHARSGGGYSTSSGTSFAVPFAATAAARLKRQLSSEDVVESLYASAQDLGAPGKDNVYGYGLLRLAAN